ncbi:TetR/AcrR family transcriptional regulator [Parachitinimonas caeni]|uniref:TetR/AcrR family transcriptional regulator n=1 Tax=Parachitinimonas caeni TaxID=3031301 RepID=A0ABT7DWY6_9NEIS|nr:TetR/AcrR family transcriptional regulator [Parachitinimonas caeni]MDK2123593.1 TetR/AcrR family transcriptional regulator [Parachitinimonas caeni]
MTTAEEKTRRTELIAAAARLFSEKGYERTTVRDLAQAVGMQSGSLFYHFRTKEEMLVAVMAAGIGDITDCLREALEDVHDPRERLTTLFRVHLNTLLGEDKGALSVLLYEWPSLSSKARDQLVPLRDEYETLWQDILNEAARAGLVPEDTSLLRRLVLGGLHWTIQWYNRQGSLSIDELADRMMALIVREPAKA